MGLIETLGLKPTKAMAGPAPVAETDAAAPPVLSAPTGAAKPATKSPADLLDEKLGREIDAITALLDPIHDDAAAAGARGDLARLVEGRAKAAAAEPKPRAVALNALLAAAAKQKPRAQALLKHDQALDRREAARKEIEVRLGQVTALVLGGINDDGLRNQVNTELKKAQAAYEKADKLHDLVAAEKAFVAQKAGVLALLARAEKAKQVTDLLGDRWRPQLAKSRAAVGALVAVAARTALAARLDQLEKDAQARVAASDLAALEGTLLPQLQRIETLALAVATSSALVDAQLDGAGRQLAAMAADAPQALVDRHADLQQRKKTSWPGGTTPDEIDAALAEFARAATALVGEIDAAKRAFDAKKAYEAAYAAMRVEVEEAQRLHAGSAALLSMKIRTDFAAARKAVDDAVALPDWVKAKAALPALQRTAAAVRKAVADERAFRAAHDPLRADVARVRSTLDSPGLPPGPGGAFDTAQQAVADAVTARDWPAALAAVPALRKALQAALETLDDGKKFYAAFAAVKPDHDAAKKVSMHSAAQNSSAKISGLVGQFDTVLKALTQEIAQEDWRPATRMLPDVQAAARALIAAQTSHDTARVPYDAARRLVPRIFDPDAVKRDLSAAQLPVFAAWKKADVAVLDAEHAGDFARATAALPALQKATDDLLDAQAAQAKAKAAFSAAWAALADYAEATQVAAAPVPALSADAEAFKRADALVGGARQRLDWDAALAGVPPLQAAATQLVAAKSAFNASVGPADWSAFEAKLKALDPRVARAGDAPVTAYVGGLQKAVLDRRGQIDAELVGKDVAAAEAGLAKLVQELDAMEQGKQRHTKHQAGFDAAKNGEIAAALALALKPPALAGERTTGLAATEAEIVKAADAGAFPRAAALIARWLTEARGWKESQAAYAELHNGKVPDVATLEALSKKPGGEQVLDAMILKLPANTPAKVLNAALKARFGFEVKRFKKPKAEVTDLAGLKPHDPEKEDPELQQVYKLLAQIPTRQIKGKVSELIDFDFDNDGGVYYKHDKKIYVHSGRVGELADGEKRLGDDVMPEGEQVDEACRPDESVKVPVSNFTLLHEAAHAEDRGTGYMEGKKGLANATFAAWVDETPKSIAAKAGPHLGYDVDYIRKTLEDMNCKPPDDLPDPPKGVGAKAWEERRQAALQWCRAIRASAGPWWKGAVCKQVAIDGRVYQESYNDGRWSSYNYAARAQGISGYQFRAAPEWFAELYAAYFADKLKPAHPATSWLKAFKPPPT